MQCAYTTVIKQKVVKHTVLKYAYYTFQTFRKYIPKHWIQEQQA